MSVARISCVLKSAVVLAWLTIGGNVASHAAPVNTPPAKTSVRSGNHRDFGRLVIDKNGTVQYMGGIDSIATTEESDIPNAEPYLEEAMLAVTQGHPVAHAATKPYGCAVKY